MNGTAVEAAEPIETPRVPTFGGAFAGGAAGALGGFVFSILPHPLLTFDILDAVFLRPSGPPPSFVELLGGLAFQSVFFGWFLFPYNVLFGALAGCCTSVIVRMTRYPIALHWRLIPVALVWGGIAYMFADWAGMRLIPHADWAFIIAGAAIAGGWPEFRAFRRRHEAPR